MFDAHCHTRLHLPQYRLRVSAYAWAEVALASYPLQYTIFYLYFTKLRVYLNGNWWEGLDCFRSNMYLVVP